jgi:hypothetical protein
LVGGKTQDHKPVYYLYIYIYIKLILIYYYLKCGVFVRQSDWTCRTSISRLRFSVTRNEPVMPFSIHVLYVQEI